MRYDTGLTIWLNCIIFYISFDETEKFLLVLQLEGGKSTMKQHISSVMPFLYFSRPKYIVIDIYCNRHTL